ncbi:MAG: helix-turn-helix domain-containing protein [Enterocloster asparagiformis]|nr:helix-turn-helix domain-containing protein [Enterocloster asparagiformis]
MFLNSNTTACILKKLEPILPYPINIMNYEGMIVNSTVPQNMGELNVAASNYIKQLHSGGQLPAAGNFDGVKSICCITVRQRIVGAIELENLLPSDSAYLALSKAIAELMLEQECMIGDQEDNISSIKDVLSILVGVHPLDTTQLVDDLQRFCVDLSIPRTTLFIQLSKFDVLELPRGNRKLVLDEKQYLYSVKKFLNQLPNFFYNKQDFILSDVSEQNAVILSVNRKEKPEVNALYLFELCTRLMEIAKKEYCLVLHAVVGIQCYQLSDYERQYEQLILRLSSGRLLFPERNVFIGNSIVLGNMITHSPKKVLQNIVSYVYGRLLVSKMSDILLVTLQTFFECDLNITMTSQKLFTHRNTLQQRFNKIEKLTGFSVHNADGLLTLRLALLCYNYLQAGGGDFPYV